MKLKYLAIVTLMLLVGCSKKKFLPEEMYLNNAIELSSTILSSKECDCVLSIEKEDKSVLEILQSDNPVFKKETLKKALGIDSDTIFNVSNKLSKSFTLPDSIYKKYKIIKVDDIIRANRDSLLAKTLFKKCPNFWINVGPAIFNEDYSKAVIPVSVGIGGNLDVYYKIDNKWKFVKSIVSWIS